MDRTVRSVTFVHAADGLSAYVVKQHPAKERLRQQWMATDDRWAARAGWSLTVERVVTSPEGHDPPTLQAGHRHWRELGNLSRLSRDEGLPSPFAPIWIHAMVSRKG